MLGPPVATSTLSSAQTSSAARKLLTDTEYADPGASRGAQASDSPSASAPVAASPVNAAITVSNAAFDDANGDGRLSVGEGRNGVIFQWINARGLSILGTTSGNGESASSLASGRFGLVVRGAGQGNSAPTVVFDNLTGPTTVNLLNGTTFQTSASMTLGNQAVNAQVLGSLGLSLTGNDLANMLTGGVGHDVLDGGAGDDVLAGDSGDDQLNGGAGRDAMRGGGGNDRYRVDRADDLVVEGADEGIDTVIATATFALPDAVENLTFEGAEALAGSGNGLSNWIVGNDGNNWIDAAGGSDVVFGGLGNDVLLGGAGADILYGEAGDDWLDGGVGADEMTGGAGNDTYTVSVADDVIVETDNGGIDTVRAVGNYVLYANIENLILLDGATVGSGNAMSNWIEGNAANNWLGGGAGHDALFGKAGDDTLYGDEGDDVLDGGAGDDVMWGGEGVDTMRGGAGNDQYYVDGPGDLIEETTGGGIDTVWTYANFMLPDYIENLQMVGADAGLGIGNDGSNWIRGNAGDNMIMGVGGGDALMGGDGDDVLVGGAGGDWMMGGVGSDTYEFERGDGLDVILDYGRNGDTDVLRIGGGTAANQLWFVRDGDALNVILTGGTAHDCVALADWYGGSGINRIERIEDGSGRYVTVAQAEAMVNALAAYATPALGTVALSTQQQAALDAAVAAYWMS